MFFNSNATYERAIRDQDSDALKALLVGIIGADPTFETSEFEEALEYIQNRSIAVNGEGIILNEDYQKQEDEYEKSEWNELYFKRNLIWLRDNFALAERLSNIKKIGEYVYKDKQTFGKTKASNRQNLSSPIIYNKESGAKKQKESVAKNIGCEYKGKRLFWGSSEWLKNNRHWILLTLIIIVFALAFIVCEKRDRKDDTSEMNTNTVGMFDMGNERNKNNLLDETFNFVIVLAYR